LLASEADDARLLLLLLLLRLLLVVVEPHLRLGCVQGAVHGAVAVTVRGFFALAIGAEHLDLLFGRQFLLNG
jgi:hypothetical protein